MSTTERPAMAIWLRDGRPDLEGGGPNRANRCTSHLASGRACPAKPHRPGARCCAAHAGFFNPQSAAAFAFLEQWAAQSAPSAPSAPLRFPSAPLPFPSLPSAPPAPAASREVAPVTLLPAPAPRTPTSAPNAPSAPAAASVPSGAAVPVPALLRLDGPRLEDHRRLLAYTEGGRAVLAALGVPARGELSEKHLLKLTLLIERRAKGLVRR